MATELTVRKITAITLAGALTGSVVGNVTGNLTGDVTGNVTGNVSGVASGNPTGPASSTDNTLARWDGTTGKVLQGSPVAVDDSGNVGGVGTLEASGIVSTSSGLAAGSTPASGGLLRLANDGAVKARNAGNSADVSLAYLTSGDIVYLGDGSFTTRLYGSTVALYAGTTLVGTVGASRLDLEKPLTLNRASNTIVNGVITVAAGYVAVDTEGSVATDDLDTINSGTDGQILYLRPANSARDVTLTKVGNIYFQGTTLAMINGGGSAVTLVYNSTDSKWIVQSFVGCTLT